MAGVTRSGAQGRAELKSLLERHGLAPRRQLGQHFLADPNTTRRIVDAAGVSEGDLVVEIGVGTGTLASELAATGARVVGFEVDGALAPLLEEAIGSQPNIDIRFEDASKLDLGVVLEDGPWTMVANLPYHVGTPILLDALRHAHQIERFVVMVQLEVGRRLVATVGQSDYGLPSVVAGVYGVAQLAFKVPPTVFVPPPNVESAVVIIDRRPAPHGAERAIELAAAGFGQRRKMLRRSLAPVLSDPASALLRAGLNPTARAEEVSPEMWLQLAEVTDD
jgi:16S rRNA (adenine1518-N6/adenine1519-N6)-dimethyltransferase